MHKWRPAPQIRFKALGLHWHAGRLLAAEVPDDAGRVKGLRPLGGSVDFGERAEDAVVREYQEELGIRVTVTGPPVFFENLYTHEGHTGHEVLALFEVSFPPGAYAARTRFSFREDNGQVCWADWVDPAALDGPGQPALYPSGLKAHLPRLQRRGA